MEKNEILADLHQGNEELIFTILEETGLNWRVIKQPINSVDESGEKMELSSYCAIQRGDNKTTFAIAKKNYLPLQNSDLVASMVKSIEHIHEHPYSKDFEHPWNNSETLGTLNSFGGGTLKGGAKVFLQYNMPEAFIGQSGIKRYLTMLNSHDLTTSIGFGFGNQVVCCENTFAVARKEISKIRHSGSLDYKVKEAVTKFKKVLTAEERTLDLFDRASKKRLTPKVRDNWTRQIFDLNEQGNSTRKKNRVAKFNTCIDKSLEEQGGNLYGLFNAVTRYTTHYIKSKDKLNGLLLGNESKINSKAMDLLIETMEMESAFL